MKHHKMSNLLNDSTVSKFVTRKWIEVSNLWGGQYYVNINTTPMRRSDLCNCSDAHIAVKQRIGNALNNWANRKLE